MIIANQLFKSYGKQEILHGVNLTVGDGEFLSIMGESGSGKSTLLSLLAGNLKPDRGEVTWDGEEISSMPESGLAKLRRTKLGFVYQSLNLISTLSVRDNILLPLYLNHSSRKHAGLEELAEELHISALLNSYPGELSGGERQRTAIARAMIHHASVLMLDEPTGSLDSNSTADVMELLCKLNRERNVTVIQVTHSAQAAAYGNRTVVISDGQVTEQ